MYGHNTDTDTAGCVYGYSTNTNTATVTELVVVCTATAGAQIQPRPYDLIAVCYGRKVDGVFDSVLLTENECCIFMVME